MALMCGSVSPSSRVVFPFLLSDNASEEQAARQDGGHAEAGAGEERAAAAADADWPPLARRWQPQPRDAGRRAGRSVPTAAAAELWIGRRRLPQTTSPAPFGLLPAALLAPAPAAVLATDVLAAIVPPLLAMGPLRESRGDSPSRVLPAAAPQLPQRLAGTRCLRLASAIAGRQNLRRLTEPRSPTR